MYLPHVPTRSPGEEEVSLCIISLYLCISLSISSLSLPLFESSLSLSHFLSRSRALARSLSLQRHLPCDSVRAETRVRPADATNLFFFITLGLELSDTKVYEP